MKYDAIVVLGAVMDWDSVKKQWTFPMIIQTYTGKLVMGEARAMAVEAIQDSTERFLITGGSDVNPETGEFASRSVELAKLIKTKYHVNPKKIIPIGKPSNGNTFGNVENTVCYLRENSEILKTGNLGVLSPRFQLERSKLMFGTNPYFSQNRINLEWLVVENILERNPLNKSWIDFLYKTPDAEICRQMEEKGIRDLLSGKYKSS